jgi:nucleotide-binding universal stress UspA family protein
MPVPPCPVASLGWHGIAAESHLVERDGRSAAAQALLAAARTCRAELMVVGAYGHRHLAQVRFGGCTQSAIEAAPARSSWSTDP